MSSSRPSFNGASAEAGSENVAKRTANRKVITLIGRRREGGQVFGGDQWSLFGDSGLAQAVENTLKSGQIRRGVAHRLPSGVTGSGHPWASRGVSRRVDLTCSPSGRRMTALCGLCGKTRFFASITI